MWIVHLPNFKKQTLSDHRARTVPQTGRSCYGSKLRRELVWLARLLKRAAFFCCCAAGNLICLYQNMIIRLFSEGSWYKVQIQTVRPPPRQMSQRTLRLRGRAVCCCTCVSHFRVRWMRVIRVAIDDNLEISLAPITGLTHTRYLWDFKAIWKKPWWSCKLVDLVDFDFRVVFFNS